MHARLQSCPRCMLEIEHPTVLAVVRVTIYLIVAAVVRKRLINKMARTLIRLDNKGVFPKHSATNRIEHIERPARHDASQHNKKQQQSRGHGAVSATQARARSRKLAQRQEKRVWLRGARYVPMCEMWYPRRQASLAGTG